LVIERRISSWWAGLVVATSAQSYQRWPLAPFPQLRRCQAEAGSPVAMASARWRPTPLVT
jgi:hypothetical protein